MNPIRPTLALVAWPLLMTGACTDYEELAHETLTGAGYSQIALEANEVSRNRFRFEARQFAGQPNEQVCHGVIGMNVSWTLSSEGTTTLIAPICRMLMGPEERALPGSAEPEAVTLARRCDNAIGNACNNLGYYFEHGEVGLPQDRARSYRLYDTACDMGSGMACGNSGLMTYQSDPTPAELVTARARFEKGCDLGDSGSCLTLAFVVERGHGGPRDVARALTLYEQACTGGKALACKNLGILYDNGTIIERDSEVAAQWFRKACDGGNSRSCGYVGIGFAMGIGVQQDKEEAAVWLQRGCDGGDAWSCEQLEAGAANG